MADANSNLYHEIPPEVSTQVLAALEKAYKFLSTNGNPLANKVGEAFASYEDAVADAEATEP